MFKGYKKLPPWLKIKYREAVKFICQNYKEHEKKVGKLIPHRIKRGNNQGLYTVAKLNSKENNVKIVCLECHKKYHSNDNKRIKSN